MNPLESLSKSVLSEPFEIEFAAFNSGIVMPQRKAGPVRRIPDNQIDWAYLEELRPYADSPLHE